MANIIQPSEPRLFLRRRNFGSGLGWKIILIVLQQVVVLILISKLNSSTVVETNQRRASASHLPPRAKIETTNDRTATHKPTKHGSTQSIVTPNMHLALAGMSLSDDDASDFAIDFLVDAACNHGIRSFILLRERDATMSLSKKIAALAHNNMLPLSLDGTVPRPKCIDWIEIRTSPSEKVLLNMTRSRIRNSPGERAGPKAARNNPLDPEARIARIKRSREYQRQILRESLQIPPADGRRAGSAIAVLDLDMFAYPSPSDLLETAREYVALPPATAVRNSRDALQTSKEKGRQGAKRYHAICSNGIFVRVKDGNYYDVRYYDTYSTILMPDKWLYREPGSLKQKQKKIVDKDTKGPLWTMNQSQTFRYIVRQGRSKIDTIMGDDVNSYIPLPVRSCFGGLTLYRADVWLGAECRYDTYHEDDAVFASDKYRHACEHVVFHECLARRMNKVSAGRSTNPFTIAVKPDMTTLWHTT